ncbi:MAG TPA: HAMP domain-containing protein [Sulfurivirga caldicuralii]|nr:HAMP domain-containing protein [Sulfurivirga caldicuralii]
MAAISALARTLRQYGLVSALSFITLAALVLLSQSLQQASAFADTYAIVLLVAVGGIVLLLIMLGRTLWKLRRQIRQNRPGSRIVLKLSMLITSLVGVPVLVIYLFALQFLSQGIDAWFDVKTETALANATELVRITLDNETRTLLNLTRSSAHLFELELTETPALALAQLRQLLNADEVALFRDDQQLIAFSAAAQGTQILPHTPPENVFQQVRQGRDYAAMEYAGEGALRHAFFRIMIPLNTADGLLILQAIFPLSQQLMELAETVKTATLQYQQRAFLREPLKTTLILILTLVLLLALFSTLLVTIQLIHNFTRPIRQLTRGTRRVATGELEPVQADTPNNELGELVRSFNDMVMQIKRARHTAQLNHQQVELQKAYLQTIISSLSNGVLTFDSRYHLRLFNQQAENILGIPLHTAKNRRLNDMLVVDEFAPLRPLWQQVRPLLRMAQGHWQQQVRYRTQQGERILLIHGAPLPGKQANGHVIVLEDITELVQAQRHAAWHEVARRLAHEIKNPLTPIQLSAERLAFKLSRHLPEAERGLLEKLTRTIVDQVQTMQTLVDAFADYARTPRLDKKPTDLNELLEQMAHLYARPGVTIELETTAACPKVSVDPNRMRQLLHNLIKNALEACQGQPTPTLWLRSTCDADKVMLSVCDNGGGLADKDLNWIFEPYATDKPKGTGLGLAIVKKIVEEHNGKIDVHTDTTQGLTCFMITLPVTAAS